MFPNGTEEHVYRAVTMGYLEVRDDGSIWRIAMPTVNRWAKTISARPITPHRIDESISKGYRIVKVMLSGVQRSTPAHRLVFRHLHGPIPHGMTVNHKNGDKQDNRPDNLELATYVEQVNHARHVLKRGRLDQYGEKNKMAKLKRSDVEEIRRRRSLGEALLSIAKDYGVTDRTISKIALGRLWAT